jgi:hypothetical protein
VRTDEEPVAGRERVEYSLREVDEYERVLAHDRPHGTGGGTADDARGVAETREELKRLVAAAVVVAGRDTGLEVIRRPRKHWVADSDVRDDAGHSRQQHRPAVVVDRIRPAPARMADGRLDAELDELLLVRLQRAQ